MSTLHPQTAPWLRLAEVSFHYATLTVFTHLTCVLEGPGITGLTGPNGAGKTTLLRLMAGLLLPATGTITCSGPVGLVPQTPALPEDLDVTQTLKIAASLAPPFAFDLATLLREHDLTALATRRIWTLSPGQRRRVDLARAMASAPGILLLDEPFAGLDPGQRASLLTKLRALSAHTRCVISSHQVELLTPLCDARYHLQSGHLRPLDLGATAWHFVARDLSAEQTQSLHARFQIQEVNQLPGAQAWRLCAPPGQDLARELVALGVHLLELGCQPQEEGRSKPWDV